MTLQNKLANFGRGLAAVTPTKHYWRPVETLPFCVWAEDSEDGSFETNNKKTQQQIHGTVDYFTKTEFDSVIDAIQDYFQTLEHFGWRLESVQYEDETNAIHYEWEFWII